MVAYRRSWWHIRDTAENAVLDWATQPADAVASRAD
jgi:hypothetical protein